ncbi:MAG: DMT family transporter [Methylococcus sp.]
MNRGIAKARDNSGPGPRGHARRGLAYMLLASALFAVMTNCAYAASLLHPPVAAAMVSFIRVMVNLILLMLPALWRRDVGGLFGDWRPSLWLRGLFGGGALFLSFASIQRIGPGESSFLTSSSGLLVAALGPWVVGQRPAFRDWLALTGAMLGLGLLLQPRMDGGDLTGRVMGLSAAFLSALAYLMIARAGRSNPPATIVFYFCLGAVVVHLGVFAWQGFECPEGWQAWGWSLAAGFCGSLAQSLMTRAYQWAPVARVSAVGYAAPVMSMALGLFLFDKRPDTLGLIGCCVILISGVALPFLSRRPRRSGADPGG